ncbi:tetratricopeptide repeat protein [candidate division KSB1 bacterium]|nr:tetratricopeptide repeat protein [candidate division KSB1 bacterium]
MKDCLQKFVAFFVLLAIAVALPAVAQNSSQKTAMDEANALFQNKDWLNAAKAFENITKKEPANFQAWNQLGATLLSLGKYDKAAAAYEKAVAINSSSPITQYNLACAYARLNDKDKAFAVLNKIMSTGFFQPEQISGDADLASLHDDPRFKELLSQAQKAVKPCTASPEYRQFDFWIGEWDVQTTSGQPAGKSSVQLILGDCVIFENWSGTFGMNGKSFSIYNATRRQWQQTWVNDRGTITEFIGEFKNDRMEFLAEQAGPDGSKQLRRMTLFNLGPDRVRQLGEVSTDEGKTWNVQYDLLYLRKK